MTILTRNGVFERVSIDHLVVGQTRITWRLRDSFYDPLPYVFQLQIGESGVNTADDWVNVGNTQTNVFQLFDTDNVLRDLAVTPSTHYRVVLTTVSGTYYSPAISCEGRLNRRDWNNARAIVRRELLRCKNHAAEIGWLYKRKKRTAAVTDPVVVDFVTGEVISTAATSGVGTDRLRGYFDPVEFWVSMTLGNRYSRRDPDRGQVDDQTVTGTSIAFPQLDHNDVWATATGDIRYVVHSVQPIVYVRQIPVINQVVLKRASPTDPIYDLALPTTPPIAYSGRLEF